MRFLKIFGLAAIAATALLAFIGASTASATVLCEETPAGDCAAGKVVAKGSTLTLSLESGTSLLMKGPFGETIGTCTESTMQGPTSNTGNTAETIKFSLIIFSFGQCNHPITVTAFGTIEAHHISGTDNGIFTSTGATFIIHATLFGSCQYSTSATSLGTLTGKTASAPTFDINAKISSENGCPQMSWSGSYISTGATNFNVSAG